MTQNGYDSGHDDVEYYKCGGGGPVSVELSYKCHHDTMTRSTGKDESEVFTGKKGDVKTLIDRCVY